MTKIFICQRLTSSANSFSEKIESMGRNTAEWFFFLKQVVRNSDAPFLKILCYLEIEKYGTVEWVPFIEEGILNEDDATVLSAAYSALASMTCVGVDKARAMILEQPQLYRRSAAMIVLCHMSEDDAIEVLIDIVNEEKDVGIRLSAAERLAYLGRTEGIGVLFENLSSDFSRRVIAACALCSLEDPTGREELHELIRSFPGLTQNDQTILISQLLCYFRKSKIVTIGKDSFTIENVLATALEVTGRF